MKTQKYSNRSEKQDIFLTTTEASKLLNVSMKTLKNLIVQGKIKTFKTPGGHHRILKEYLFENFNGYSTEASSVETLSRDSQRLYEMTADFVAIIESRQRYCQGHGLYVSRLSALIAEDMRLAPGDIERISKAALVHDIGMIHIPEHILNSKKVLLPKDYEIVKRHPLIGGDILGKLEFFGDIVMVVKQHHERLNGTGYPYGIKGRNICLEARILAVAETFCSLTAADSYKKSCSFESAVATIKEDVGSLFDGAVAASLERCAVKLNDCEMS
ncbi:MAG: HD domain-containing protein [Candidatus Moranbacteria bacterium]|nr:HD domain-containing protein [Candidatus Moranbacteria bacterium]